MNKQTWWITTKIAGVILTSIATYNVFHAAFEQSITEPIFFIPRSTAIFLGVFVAFVLVDLLYVMLVTFLEAERSEGEAFSARWGQVISLWVLYIFIVAIGFADEGIIAFAPRIGLGILALNATLKYISEWQKWRDETWEDRFNRARHRRAEKDYIGMLEYERKLKNKVARSALLDLSDRELKDEYYSQYADLLLNRPTSIPEGQYYIAGGDSPESKDMESYVYQEGSGWVWEDPYTGEKHKTTATGKPYSESGAKRALGRYLANRE